MTPQEFQQIYDEMTWIQRFIIDEDLRRLSIEMDDEDQTDEGLIEEYIRRLQYQEIPNENPLVETGDEDQTEPTEGNSAERIVALILAILIGILTWCLGYGNQIEDFA